MPIEIPAWLQVGSLVRVSHSGEMEWLGEVTTLPKPLNENDLIWVSYYPPVHGREPIAIRGSRISEIQSATDWIVEGAAVDGGSLVSEGGEVSSYDGVIRIISGNPRSTSSEERDRSRIIVRFREGERERTIRFREFILNYRRPNQDRPGKAPIWLQKGCILEDSNGWRGLVDWVNDSPEEGGYFGVIDMNVEYPCHRVERVFHIDPAILDYFFVRTPDGEEVVYTQVYTREPPDNQLKPETLSRFERLNQEVGNAGQEGCSDSTDSHGEGQL